MSENTPHSRHCSGMNSGISKNISYSGIPTKAKRKKIGGQAQAKSISSVNAARNSFESIRQRRTFPTDYCGLIKRLPANLPSSLIRGITASNESAFKKKENPGLGKVKIMLRVSSDPALTQSTMTQEFLRVEENKKHVSVFVPSHPEERNKALAPKVYAFDSVFTEESSLEEISTASLVDVIQAVLQGADGAVFCYGQSNLGKTFVLFGKDFSIQNVGIVPNAINWLYRCIDELKDHQNIRLFIRVSAVEVYGRSEKLKDLLVGFCEDGPVSKICISEDPLLGTQLQNVCETSASTAEKAAYLLDVALASRSCNRQKSTPEARKHSHMFYTLHVYQHKVERNGEGGVSGGRSRLHFIDLGSCEKTLVKTTNSLALSHTSLGHVIMSIVNNSKHVPFKESKLTRVLREHLGNVNCRAVMLAHVSRDVAHYTDTLSTIQMASRIHRVLKKKTKMLYDGQNKMADSRYPRSRLLKYKYRDDESVGSSTGLEYTSGSELSCDTVVYVNKNGVPMSDLEFTDNEGPPEVLPINQTTTTIPLSVTAASSYKDGEMVYNIAQAKVQKLQSGMISHPNVLSRNCALPATRSTRTHSNSGLTNLQPVLMDTETKKVLRTPEKRASNLPKKLLRSRLSKASKISPSQVPKSNRPNSSLKSSNTNAFKTSSIPTTSIPKIHRKIQKHSSEQGPPKRDEVDIASKNCLKQRCKDVKRDTASLTPIKPPRQLKGNSQKNLTKQTKIPNRQIALTRPSKSIPTGTKSDETTCSVPPTLKFRYKSRSETDGQSTLHERNIVDTSSYVENLHCNKTTISNHSAVVRPVQNVNITADKPQNRFSFNCHRGAQICSEKLPPETERPDPVGCAFDSESKVDITNSFVNPTYCDLNYIAKSCARPDSMVVNVDGEEVCSHGDSLEDKDGVDVNFYCLTFTTRNPLIPMSKRNFSQQIRNNIKRKSLIEVTPDEFVKSDSITEIKDTETNEFDNNNVYVRSSTETSSLFKTNKCENRLTDNYFASDSENFNNATGNSIQTQSFYHVQELAQSTFEAEQLVAFGEQELTLQERNPSADEDDFAGMQDLKEMPKLQCDYANNTNRRKKPDNDFGSLTSKYSQSSFRSCYNSPHHEVCLYDSNSLAISYVNTKHNLSSSSESASRSSTSSPSTSKRDDFYRNNEALQRSSTPVVVTKSTSKEGARLTLVKKHKRGGSTLELLITDENDTNNNDMTTSKQGPTSRANNVKMTKKLPLSKLENSKVPTGSQNSPKKSKWSGLKRFGSKKNAKDVKATTSNADTQKSKTSLVSKLLPGKSKSNVSCEKHKEKSQSPSTKDRQQKPTRSKIKNGTASTSMSRTNLRVSQSLSQATKNKERRPTYDLSQTSSSSSQKESTLNTGSSSSRYGFPRKSKLK